jgi:hypothetical protein
LLACFPAPPYRAPLLTLDAACVLRLWKSHFRSLGLQWHVSHLGGMLRRRAVRVSLRSQPGTPPTRCAKHIAAPTTLRNLFDVDRQGPASKTYKSEHQSTRVHSFTLFQIPTMRSNGQRDGYRFQYFLSDSQLGPRNWILSRCCESSWQPSNRFG